MARVLMIGKDPVRYSYATMPLAAVYPLLAVPVPSEGYLSKDANSEALRKLLGAGYRWVRTDGEMCVFERMERGRRYGRGK